MLKPEKINLFAVSNSRSMGNASTTSAKCEPFTYLAKWKYDYKKVFFSFKMWPFKPRVRWSGQRHLKYSFAHCLCLPCEYQFFETQGIFSSVSTLRGRGSLPLMWRCARLCLTRHVMYVFQYFMTYWTSYDLRSAYVACFFFFFLLCHWAHAVTPFELGY